MEIELENERDVLLFRVGFPGFFSSNLGGRTVLRLAFGSSAVNGAFCSGVE